MRLLVDTCVWGGRRSVLTDAGHDVVWAGSWDTDPGDEEILARANQDGRVLVTLDKDFGELVAVRGLPHAGIIRLVNLRAEAQMSSLLHVLEAYAAELAQGAILTVEPGRVRVRPADAPPR